MGHQLAALGYGYGSSGEDSLLDCFIQNREGGGELLILIVEGE